MPTNVAHIAPVADPDPEPLTPTVTPRPFPDVFPGWLSAMIAATAEATQTDPAMGGNVAVAVLAACAGGRVKASPRSGWVEPLSVFTVTIARPGERKSAVHGALTRPLLDAERELADQVRAERIEAEARADVLAGAATKARKTAADKHGRDGAQAAAQEALDVAREAEDAANAVPPIPRRVADDATPEAVVRLLAEQGGALALLSAEGGVFDILAGRYSTRPNLDPFLKGHAGELIRVDRTGRASEYVPDPALTVGVMVQPSVLDDLGQVGTFAGRGLLARFLYARPASRVGHRLARSAPVPAETTAAYAVTVRALMLGLDRFRDTDPRPVLTFTDGADDALADFQADTEGRLREGADLGSDDLAAWGSKLPGAVVRLAGLLHLAELGAGGINTPVDAATVLDAVALADYYTDQARAVFGHMGTDDPTRQAAYLLRRLGTVDADHITERDMRRLARSIKTREQLTTAVTRLVETGWLIPTERPDKGAGRPGSPLYRIHARTKENQ